MLSMERGFGRFLLAIIRLLRRRRRVGRTLPLIDSYPAAFGRRVGFFEEWLAHPERTTRSGCHGGHRFPCAASRSEMICAKEDAMARTTIIRVPTFG